MSPPALGTRWRAKPKLTTQRGLLTTMSDVDGVATRATAQGASAVLIACVTFVVLTAFAMLEYPGGSLHVPGTHHYVFSENFLGDLGVTKTAAGSNTSSCVLFVIAMTCVG